MPFHHDMSPEEINMHLEGRHVTCLSVPAKEGVTVVLALAGVFVVSALALWWILY